MREEDHGHDEEEQKDNHQHSASALLESGSMRKGKITDMETECSVKSKKFRDLKEGPRALGAVLPLFNIYGQKT